MTFDEALRKALTWMDTIEGVHGVAEGTFEGRKCINVFVGDSRVASRLPKRIGTYSVVVRESGGIRSAGC
jgi:hypothetical protein